MSPLNVPNDVNFECPFQEIKNGKFICKVADKTRNYTTNETNPSVCLNCPAGKIYREVGCDAFSPRIMISQHFGKPGEDLELVEPEVLCTKRKAATTIEYCKTCSLVTAATTKEILNITKDLFQVGEYNSSYRDFEKARKCLRDADYSGSITSSISFLESTIRTSLEKLGEELPNSKGLTGLWSALKGPLHLNEIDNSECCEKLIGTLSGVVSHLGGLRNNLSDAHGNGSEYPNVYFSIAELAINSSATVATLIVRRTNQILGESYE